MINHKQYWFSSCYFVIDKYEIATCEYVMCMSVMLTQRSFQVTETTLALT